MGLQPVLRALERPVWGALLLVLLGTGLPTSGAAQARDTCYVNKRVWIPQHFNQGRRVVVPGHWGVRRMPVPCPPSAGRSRCVQPTLNQLGFEHAVRQISTRAVEAGRVSAFRTVVQAHCLSSRQVRVLLELLAYEDSRLRMAHYAYPKVADPQNYELVARAMLTAAGRARFMAGLQRLRGY